MPADLQKVAADLAKVTVQNTKSPLDLATADFDATAAAARAVDAAKEAADAQAAATAARTDVVERTAIVFAEEESVVTEAVQIYFDDNVQTPPERQRRSLVITTAGCPPAHNCLKTLTKDYPRVVFHTSKIQEGSMQQRRTK